MCVCASAAVCMEQSQTFRLHREHKHVGPLSFQTHILLHSDSGPFFSEAILLSFRQDEATSPHTRHSSPASASEMATEALRGRDAAQRGDVLRDRSGCLKLSVAPAAPRGDPHLFESSVHEDLRIVRTTDANRTSPVYAIQAV